MLHEGVRLSIWQYDKKSRTRAISLESKMLRKDPVDTGLKQKGNEGTERAQNNKKTSYEANLHFELQKLCHSVISGLKTIKKAQKKTNNYKVEREQQKYKVITIQQLKNQKISYKLSLSQLQEPMLIFEISFSYFIDFL